jgi:hypothetical protein
VSAWIGVSATSRIKRAKHGALYMHTGGDLDDHRSRGRRRSTGPRQKGRSRRGQDTMWARDERVGLKEGTTERAPATVTAALARFCHCYQHGQNQRASAQPPALPITASLATHLVYHHQHCLPPYPSLSQWPPTSVVLELFQSCCQLPITAARSLSATCSHAP